MSTSLGQTWEDYILEKGEVRARQEDLRELLEERFGELPGELIERIEAIMDSERLKACIRQAVHIESLGELKL